MARACWVVVLSVACSVLMVVAQAPEAEAETEPELDAETKLEGGPESEPEAEPRVGEPGFVAPNAPQCAVDWVDNVDNLVNVAKDIAMATTTCAYQMGWSGQTLSGDLQINPFHDPRDCADLILEVTVMLSEVTVNFEDAAFSCFGSDQVCAESCASAFQLVVDAGRSFIKPASDCVPIGSNPPFNSNKDPSIQGWQCWADLWHVVQRIIKAAKYVDTAIGSCASAAPEPEGEGAPEPEPEGEGAPEPEAEAEPSAAQLGAVGSFVGLPTSPASAPFAVGAGARQAPAQGSAEASAAAKATVDKARTMAWEQLEQPEPFASISGGLAQDAGVLAAERRRRLADAEFTQRRASGREAGTQPSLADVLAKLKSLKAKVESTTKPRMPVFV